MPALIDVDIQISKNHASLRTYMRRKTATRRQKPSLPGADKQSPEAKPPPPHPSTPHNISYHHRGTVPHVIMTLAESGHPARWLARAIKRKTHSGIPGDKQPQEEGEKVEQHPPRCSSKWSARSWRTNAGGAATRYPRKWRVFFCLVVFLPTGEDGRPGRADVGVRTEQEISDRAGHKDAEFGAIRRFSGFRKKHSSLYTPAILRSARLQSGAFFFLFFFSLNSLCNLFLLACHFSFLSLRRPFPLFFIRHMTKY